MPTLTLNEAERCAVMNGLVLLHMNAHMQESGEKPFVQSLSAPTDPVHYARDRDATPLSKDEVDELLQKVAYAR
jgi:hypothetical protein